MGGAQSDLGRDVYKRCSELSIHAGTQLPTVKMIAGLETVDGSHGAVEEIVQESHTAASSNRNKIAALPDHGKILEQVEVAKTGDHIQAPGAGALNTDQAVGLRTPEATVRDDGIAAG